MAKIIKSGRAGFLQFFAVLIVIRTGGMRSKSRSSS